jgi:molybdenum cofactor cytidylyltransferase
MTTPNMCVAAVVLAAGSSSRMGDLNKLLALINGMPLVCRVLEQVRQSQADPIIVVTGHQADHVRDALEGCDVTFAQNDDFANGLSTSLRRGLEALPETVSGALICLGDMPNLRAGQIDALIAVFQKHRGEKICVPVFKGRQGNPVLWPQSFFPAMQALRGDAGAKKFIGENRDHVIEVAMTDDGVTQDIDTLEQLKKF